MNKLTRRELLRSALVGAGVGAGITSLPGCHSMSVDDSATKLSWRNWAGDYACRPSARLAPKDEDALLRLLRLGRGTIRPVGAGHSFSPLVPTEDTLIACDFMSGVVEVDTERLEAEVWAGTRLHALGPALEPFGQALPNQPDIDDQALGGAIATSTHGTGVEFGSLSAYVEGLHLATPTGELIYCDREVDSDLFQAARCSLGSLGIVSRLRLRNERPRRLVETTIVVPIDELLADAPRLRDTHRHMEFMALPHARLGLLITTDETEDQSIELAEDPTSVEQLRQAWAAVDGQPGAYREVVLAALSGEGAPRVGPSHQVLAHARYARFREMEYTVPAEAGPECLARILDTIERDALPVVFPIEYRYVHSDDIWLSMFEGRDGCSISLHQYADEDHQAVFAQLEPIFWEFQGRPHWGKLHSLGAAQLRSLYPHWDDFGRVRREIDGHARMENSHLRHLFESD